MPSGVGITDRQEGTEFEAAELPERQQEEVADASRWVKEIAMFGGDIAKFVSADVCRDVVARVEKIGRRGSLNAWITVNGAQGHVGYPHMADNPITRLVAIVAELKARVLDEGNDWFQASNLEITDLAVGNPATNLIPAQARARLNIRFNNEHTGASLSEWIRATVATHAPASHVEIKISGEAFLTEPGALSYLVSAAITDVTGLTPDLSTTGGTSDARFIRSLCPVVEFGLPGQSMHKVDEHAAVADVTGLTAIYEAVLARALA